MDVVVAIEGRTCRLAVEGEMTIFNAAELKDRLLQALSQCGPGMEMDIHLSQVAEIDASGLQLLALLKREAAAGDVPLRLHGHSMPVLEMLDTSGLTGVFGDPVILSDHRKD